MGQSQRVQNPIERLRPKALAFFGAWILFMGGNEILRRLWLQVDGVVMSSQTTDGPRPVTTYRLRRADGSESGYVAGPTDASLQRRLPVGTTIRKERWRFSYEKDGSEDDTFPILFYVGLLLGGLLLEWVAWTEWRRQKHYRRRYRDDAI